MMFILAANQSCGFSEPSKLFKNHNCLFENCLICEKDLFYRQKGQMGHEKYMLGM